MTTNTVVIITKKLALSIELYKKMEKMNQQPPQTTACQLNAITARKSTRNLLPG